MRCQYYRLANITTQHFFYIDVPYWAVGVSLHIKVLSGQVIETIQLGGLEEFNSSNRMNTFIGAVSSANYWARSRDITGSKILILELTNTAGGAPGNTEIHIGFWG